MYYEKYLNNLYTSSGWAEDETFAKLPGCLKGSFDSDHTDGGVVLSSRDGRVIADGGNECRHVLVIGATGTGKSRLVIIPSLLYSLSAKNKRSYVVFDVKGELEIETAATAKSNGYRIRKVDFRSPENGDNWNPFHKINRLYKEGGNRQSKAWKLLEDMIAGVFNDGEHSTMDPFWRTISASIFRGICATLWEMGEELSMIRIQELANSIPEDADDDPGCQLFQNAYSLPDRSVARRNLGALFRCSKVTRGNVLASYNTYLAHLTSRDDVMSMMSGAGSLDFQNIGMEPTVLYVSLPDDTTALGTLQGMLLTQLMQDLNECAMRNGGILPVRTEMYLDEICNIHPAIPSLETALTISRSRGIRYILAIQSYNQLLGVYGQAAETIAANCSTWIALNISKDETFRDKLSRLCGENALGAPLITPSQLALLKYEEGIVIRERSEPYFSRFEDLSKVKEHIRLLGNKSTGRRECQPSAHRRRRISA